MQLKENYLASKCRRSDSTGEKTACFSLLEAVGKRILLARLRWSVPPPLADELRAPPPVSFYSQGLADLHLEPTHFCRLPFFPAV